MRLRLGEEVETLLWQRCLRRAVWALEWLAESVLALWWLLEEVISNAAWRVWFGHGTARSVRARFGLKRKEG